MLSLEFILAPTYAGEAWVVDATAEAVAASWIAVVGALAAAAAVAPADLRGASESSLARLGAMCIGGGDMA